MYKYTKWIIVQYVQNIQHGYVTRKQPTGFYYDKHWRKYYNVKE